MKKKEEEVEFTDVKEEKEIFTNLDAVSYHRQLSDIEDGFYNVKKVVKNKSGEDVQLEYPYDTSKLNFTGKLIFAIPKNLGVLKKASDSHKENGDIMQKAFKKEFNITDEDISKNLDSVNEKYKEFSEREDNKKILEDFAKKEFKCELHRIEQSDLDDSMMPSFMREILQFLVKKD